MHKLPISCFIIAKNEADRIARTIRSVNSWVDQVVVVVDSQSSDDTVGVARSEGAEVITHDWLGFGAQKRFAENQCKNNWLLNLDADEIITPDLKREITGLFDGGSPAFSAYGMPIRLIYPGETSPRLWARDHWYVRLYDRRVVRFRNSAIHDAVVTNGHRVGRLRACMHHHSIRSFDDMRRKLNERAWLSVAHADIHSTAPLLPRILTEIPVSFLKYYVGRRHFTGGIAGLRYASIQSWYRFLKICRMRHARSLLQNITAGNRTGAHNPIRTRSKPKTRASVPGQALHR